MQQDELFLIYSNRKNQDNEMLEGIADSLENAIALSEKLKDQILLQDKSIEDVMIKVDQTRVNELLDPETIVKYTFDDEAKSYFQMLHKDYEFKSIVELTDSILINDELYNYYEDDAASEQIYLEHNNNNEQDEKVQFENFTYAFVRNGGQISDLSVNAKISIILAVGFALLYDKKDQCFRLEDKQVIGDSEEFKTIDEVIDRLDETYVEDYFGFSFAGAKEYNENLPIYEVPVDIYVEYTDEELQDFYWIGQGTQNWDMYLKPLKEEIKPLEGMELSNVSFEWTNNSSELDNQNQNGDVVDFIVDDDNGEYALVKLKLNKDVDNSTKIVKNR